MARTKRTPKNVDKGDDVDGSDVSSDKDGSIAEEDTCLCKEWIDEAQWIQCDTCDQWWHTNCVGLLGLDDNMVNSIKKYECPCCFRFAENVEGAILLAATQVDSSSSNSSSTAQCSSIRIALKEEIAKIDDPMEFKDKIPQNKITDVKISEEDVYEF